MDTILLILILFPVMLIGFIYITFSLGIAIATWIGVQISLILPIIFFVFIGISIIYLISKNIKKTITKEDFRHFLGILVLISVLFTVRTWYVQTKTSEFQNEIIGNTYSCDHSIWKYFSKRSTTYYDVKFIDSEYCNISERFVPYSVSSEEKQSGPTKQKYYIMRIFNGNYVIKIDKKIFSFKARKNKPRNFGYDIDMAMDL